MPSLLDDPVGADAPETVPSLALNAGPLSLFFEDGYIRSIRLGGVEIVRRVYFALRDELWNTIPGVFSEFSVQRHDTSFTISFNSRNCREAIDFLWRAEITGKQSGEVVYSMRGIALSEFKRNRIGLCVLHPLGTCRGTACRIETVDGQTRPGVFPPAIAPHQPFTNLRAMSYEIVSGLNAIIRFDGDIFETEDQRNWTDASYKTYSTPISLPVPVAVGKGAMVQQEVRISIDKPTAPLVHVPFSLQMDCCLGEQTHRIPRIGACASGAGMLQTNATALLRKLSLSHIRADLRFDHEDTAPGLERCATLARTFELPIELALHFGDDPREQAAALATRFRNRPFPAARILVFRTAERSVSAQTIASVKETVRELFPDAAIASGTDGHFVEINRVRPPYDLLDAVTYAATPQVHTFDSASIMENLPGLLETLKEAASIAPHTDIMISPLTLRPRKNPLTPKKDGGPDRRQKTLFAAAWLAGALAYCTEGNACVITLGEMAGPGGLADAQGASAYPLAVVLAWIAQYSGAPAQCRFTNDPSQVSVLLWRHENRFHAVVANLDAGHRTVRLSGLPREFSCAILDEKTAALLKNAPDPASAVPDQLIATEDGSYSLELSPYATAKIEGR
ncbi:MAG: hypothetical protein JXA71_00190 [Chitinispirillaceae bacterium]|nr:hypothetical protein [Chitinispirillaceae bacterium]